EHPPGGQKHQRKGGSLLEAEVTRDRSEVDLGHDDCLGIGAVPMFAQDLPAIAEAVLAPDAVLANPVAEPWVEEHAGADGVAGCTRAVGQHHPGAISAADV